MPYEGELASKVAHADFVKNPDIAAFLAECDYLQIPSEAETKAICAHFVEAPPVQQVVLPIQVLAVDGSLHETSIDEQLPSTKFGFVKVGCVLIRLSEYASLMAGGGRYVDPFRVAKLQDNNEALTFPLPSANIHWKGKGSVRDGFRAAVDAHLYGQKTRFVPSDPLTSLRTTLFHLASRRSGPLGTNDPHRLRIHACPSCGQGPVEVQDVAQEQYCSFCSAVVYPSDCLRLWEEVGELQSNTQALSRFMLQVEHLLPSHYIRYLRQASLQSLAGITFFLDGPLAVFGNGAWLHATIMRYIAEVNAQLATRNLPGVLLLGLQKTGQVADYLRMISRFLPADRLLALDDDFRYQYILASRDPAQNGFGSETYYGQDFLYKTPSGRIFVLGLHYPFATKQIPGMPFAEAKVELARYSELPRALALIQHFECELYENAVVPIALAHHYTAISLQPGGRVLDLLTRQTLQGTA